VSMVSRSWSAEGRFSAAVPGRAGRITRTRRRRKLRAPHAAYRRRHATYCGTDPSGSGLRYGRPPVAAANSARAAARAVGFVISSNPVSAIALAA
jgi:hypothetical protein